MHPHFWRLRLEGHVREARVQSLRKYCRAWKVPPLGVDREVALVRWHTAQRMQRGVGPWGRLHACDLLTAEEEKARRSEPDVAPTSYGGRNPTDLLVEAGPVDFVEGESGGTWRRSAEGVVPPAPPETLCMGICLFPTRNFFQTVV